MNLAQLIDAIPVVQSTADRAARFGNPTADQRVWNKETKALERFDAAIGWTVDPVSLGNPGRLSLPVSAAAAGAGRGPCLVELQEATFNGALDPNITVGYNMGSLGQLLVGTEPGAGWCIEGYYDDGTGQVKMEMYTQFKDPGGVEFQRPYFASYNRTTKRATPFISGDQIFFGRAIAGGLSGSTIGYFQDDGVNGVYCAVEPAVYAGPSYFQVKAHAGTEGGILFGITGTTLAKIICAINTRVDVLVNGRATAFFYATPNGAAGDSFSVGINENSAVGLFNNTGPNSLKCVVGRAKATQTGDIFQAQDSGSNPLAGIQVAGDLYATGGFRMTIDGWYQENVAASQVSVPLTRLATTTEAPTRWIALRAGSITGVNVKANTARTAGTCTIKVFKNGAQIGTLTAVLDGTNTTFKATTQAKDIDTFVAGDELELTVTTDAGWLPVTNDIRASLEVEQ